MFNINITESKKPGQGPIIEMMGPWVNEYVHDTVSRLMNDNWTDSPIYQARRKCNAFFQGGSNDRNGHYIKLEFWAEESETVDFIKILNDHLSRVIPTGLIRIPIHPDRIDGGLVTLSMISEDVDCRLDAGNAFTPCYFHPENTKQYMDVVRHILSFNGQYNMGNK